jgi:hypothetical protein
MLRKKDSWFHFKARGYILSTLKGYELIHFVRRISSTGVMRACAILLKEVRSPEREVAYVGWDTIDGGQEASYYVNFQLCYG